MPDRIQRLQRRPDLILCDYRLRDGENGIGAIKHKPVAGIKLRATVGNLMRTRVS